MSISWKPILAHAVTVVVTLMLVMVLFGDRLGLRRPPLAQIRGLSPELAPPAPQPIPPSSVGRPAASAGVAAQVPAPPEDVLKDLDPDERNNIRVYAAVNKSVVNITTESEGQRLLRRRDLHAARARGSSSTSRATS